MFAGDHFDFKRKSPEAILHEMEILKHGKLKLYIGSAPGVGKTYRMLLEAHELKQEGIDVVVGLIETHNRPDTMNLFTDLEIVPLKDILYKGKSFKELNVEGIIARNPDVVVIDELAHTNVPGSLNEKRYSDVQDILANGIHVISAVNIQHLESLHDIVQQITGVHVRERIPDSILNSAQEVILVDVTPEILQKRLKEGKIYSSNKIEQALQNFFTKSNLLALRELSLREVANDVDEKAEKENEKNGFDTTPAGTCEKILVCIQNDQNAEKLIRRGWRIASRLKAQLYIFHGSRKEIREMNQKEMKKIEGWEQLSIEFNAKFILKNLTNKKVAKAITEVTKEYHITQIILGQSAKSRLEELTKGSIVNDIMRLTSGIDIHIVAEER
ncbi:universal stress protein [Bacillus sp. APMAM]|nr:universal stress protein [Bacillus sp. APMAM]RTZ55839.1 sensor histidine kinase KdpD [Bacillus sp. SAJ1]